MPEESRLLEAHLLKPSRVDAEAEEGCRAAKPAEDGPGTDIPWRRKAAVEDRRTFVTRAAVDDRRTFTKTSRCGDQRKPKKKRRLDNRRTFKSSGLEAQFLQDLDFEDFRLILLDETMLDDFEDFYWMDPLFETPKNAAPRITDDIRTANTTTSVISWQYNWGTSPPDYLAKSGIPYIPMQWGSYGVETFGATVKMQGATTIFGFNEPDLSSQSNINATYATTLEEAHQSTVEIWNSLGSSCGFKRTQRLAAFFAACSSCEIDFIPFHWSIFFEMWLSLFSLVSQLAPLGDRVCLYIFKQEVADFLNASVPYMDSLDWIQGYSWFAFFTFWTKTGL
ncbi:hypothetical protein GALMADRAFT_134252 [Galerina marginata CBS 339.88]|uniref:Asl1-like glycosyl hydrolase catalytic domain-containing protein n=1 Tax=Galerina marginata (strain CBS 339.88) TaxID=685588 RepID=A0A067THH6_GALM3|nr:hypothetical protein GALMADRAFT_134252 [Galerina marginata CBS 339.88]